MQAEANDRVNLFANDHFPFARMVIRRFRDACRENPYTRWLQPKQILRPEYKELALPLSSTVIIGEHTISVTPNEIIGFKVSGSSTRILLIGVDYGRLPIERGIDDSVFLRTRALVAAISPLNRQLRPGQIIVAWIMDNSERLQELKFLCRDHAYSRVRLVDKKTFVEIDDVLSIKWENSDNESHTLI
jgi:hypothetical protein